MANVQPFQALRPTPSHAAKVAALPYDVMNREEAAKLAQGNPYSFLHVSRSEIDMDAHISPYDDTVYEKAAQNLTNMVDEGVLVQDETPKYYIYRQVMEGRSQTGIVARCAIDDYQNDVIKKHEFTRPEKEIDRIKHFDFCNANTEPVFLAYRSRQEISNIVNHWIDNHQPIYDFTSEDGIAHVVWVVDATTTITELANQFRAVKNLYIADGHHRTASATKVGLQRREKNPGYTGEEAFNFFLSVIFPDDELLIMDYNRVVTDLHGLSKNALVAKVAESFAVEDWQNQGPYRPQARHSFGMYVEGKWYKLTANPEIVNEDDPLERLDVNILQQNLLAPILGIADPRTDSRIGFVGGIRGLEELERRANSDMKIAFSLFPPSMEELFAISDVGEVMPPKSTWFEPKLRSGLFVHLFT